MEQRKQSAHCRLIISLLLSIFIIASCTPPRAIYNSGKVTPHKQFKAGGDFSANFTSHIARSLYDNVKSVATPLITKDSLTLNEQIVYLNKTALAYALDPFGAGYGFYARYGLLPRFDLGYKFSSGTHVFDGMYQFMGSTGTFDAPQKNVLNGSIGVQYSFKNYDLPSWSGMDKAQSVLGFNFKREDLLVPVIFSLSFGDEETYGSLGFGCVYTKTATACCAIRSTPAVWSGTGCTIPRTPSMEPVSAGSTRKRISSCTKCPSLVLLTLRSGSACRFV